MPPVGAVRVTAVLLSQMPGYSRCDALFQGRKTDVNPGLQAAWAGLKHQTGVMSIPAHSLHNLGVRAVQINKNVAGVLIPGAGLNVDIVSFAIANTQESDGCRMEQLGSRPQPLSRKCPA